MNSVWVFNGPNSSFPSGIFADQEQAHLWIQSRRLSGVLTEYPVGMGVYEWAIEQKYFTPTKPHQTSPEFIAGFSSASQAHHHYEQGVREA